MGSHPPWAAGLEPTLAGQKKASRLRWRSELAWLTIGSFPILIWEVAGQQADRAIPQLREFISSASPPYGGCGRPPIS